MAESRTRVLVAGGGVAGLEALYALRALAGERVEITLIAPDDEFVYRPLAVEKPFEVGRVRRVPLTRAALQAGAELPSTTVEAVDRRRRLVTTSGGDQLRYDALLLAVGATSVAGGSEGLDLGRSRGFRIAVESAARVEVEPARPRVIVLHPSGRRIEVDRILALPALRGRPIAGVPTDGDGFLEVDKHGRVRGVDGLWAAGDTTAFPLKSGGFAPPWNRSPSSPALTRSWRVSRLAASIRRTLRRATTRV